MADVADAVEVHSALNAPPSVDGCDVVIVAAHAHALDGGRPGARPAVPVDLSKQAHVIQLAPWLRDGNESDAGPQGAMLRLGHVLTGTDPLLIRWRKALEEGVPVAPLNVPCAPLDCAVAVRAVMSLVIEKETGQFAISAPDEVRFAEIAEGINKRLALPADRIVPSDLEPAAFALADWPSTAVLHSSPWLARRGIVARPARQVVGDALQRLFG